MRAGRVTCHAGVGRSYAAGESRVMRAGRVTCHAGWAGHVPPPGRSRVSRRRVMCQPAGPT
eukprot:1853234-Prymnesium_polylepis.1